MMKMYVNLEFHDKKKTTVRRWKLRINKIIIFKFINILFSLVSFIYYLIFLTLPFNYMFAVTYSITIPNSPDIQLTRYANNLISWWTPSSQLDHLNFYVSTVTMLQTFICILSITVSRDRPLYHKDNQSCLQKSTSHNTPTPPGVIQ